MGKSISDLHTKEIQSIDNFCQLPHAGGKERIVLCNQIALEEKLWLAAVIGRFLGDLNVVGMAFRHPGT